MTVYPVGAYHSPREGRSQAVSLPDTVMTPNFAYPSFPQEMAGCVIRIKNFEWAVILVAANVGGTAIIRPMLLHRTFLDRS